MAKINLKAPNFDAYKLDDQHLLRILAQKRFLKDRLQTGTAEVRASDSLKLGTRSNSSWIKRESKEPY